MQLVITLFGVVLDGKATTDGISCKMERFASTQCNPASHYSSSLGETVRGGEVGRLKGRSQSESGA